MKLDDLKLWKNRLNGCKIWTRTKRTFETESALINVDGRRDLVAQSGEQLAQLALIQVPPADAPTHHPLLIMGNTSGVTLRMNDFFYTFIYVCVYLYL